MTNNGKLDPRFCAHIGARDVDPGERELLALIAATDPSAKLTNDLFLEAPYGIGIKQGNVQLKRWVDARLNLMKQKDLFMPIIRNNVAPRFVNAFARNVLRPNNNFTYRPASLPSVDTVCP